MSVNSPCTASNPSSRHDYFSFGSIGPRKLAGHYLERLGQYSIRWHVRNLILWRPIIQYHECNKFASNLSTWRYLAINKSNQWSHFAPVFQLCTCWNSPSNCERQAYKLPLDYFNARSIHDHNSTVRSYICSSCSKLWSRQPSSLNLYVELHLNTLISARCEADSQLWLCR